MAGLGTLQHTAVLEAQRYLGDVLRAQGIAPDPVGALVVDAFTGVASDGRDLDDLLFQPVIGTLTEIGAGVPVDEAVAHGEESLATIVNTQVSDTGRIATDVAMTADHSITGYVRMLVPPSCGRCAILAGKFFRWNEGFLRHPRCDCVHIAASEDTAGDLRTDPQQYFNSLSKADQNRYFTKAGAEAIRLGADMNQVVNARRGARGLSQPGRLTAAEQDMLRGGRKRGRLDKVDVYGRQLEITTEGTTRRGIAGKKLIAIGGETGTRSRTERRADRAAGQTGRVPGRAKVPRLMPEAIAEIAEGDRDTQIKLLKRFGYLT